MAFEKKVEDFICEHCSASVTGSGYTNHCPTCLWSKHVDEDPGDRASPCGGMMEPVRVEGATPEYVLVHTCVKCGHKKKNMLNEKDDMDEVVGLARRREEEY